MARLNLFRLVILIAGAVLALLGLVAKLGPIVESLSQTALLTADGWLLVAFAIGLAMNTWRVGTLSLVRLIGSSVALGIAMLTLIFAFAGSGMAATLTVCLAAFAILNVVLAAETWTRSFGLALTLSAVLWLATSPIFISGLRESIGQWTLWLTSLMLDAIVVEHLRLEAAIQTIGGDYQAQAALDSWVGIFPVLCFCVIPTILWRRSLIQYCLTAFCVILFWIVYNSVTSTWVIWGVSVNGSEVEQTNAVISFISGLVLLGCSWLVAIAVGGLSDQVPLGRSDWEYPVSTYFWNFFTQFPSSLFGTMPQPTSD